MDSDIVLLLLVAVGLYFYMQSNQQPTPSIGDKIGNALVGLKDQVLKDAAAVDSFFKNDVNNFFVDYGNNVKANIVHDAYVVDNFFQNDVNNFFVDTIGGGVQDAANQVKNFFENTIPNEASNASSEIKNFFENTVPSWFGF